MKKLKSGRCILMIYAGGTGSNLKKRVLRKYYAGILFFFRLDGEPTMNLYALGTKEILDEMEVPVFKGYTYETDETAGWIEKLRRVHGDEFVDGQELIGCYLN